MKKKTNMQNQGFTLVELMIAMVVSIIVIGAIYATYLSQTRIRIAQEVNIELQESLRAALVIMEREIRTAGTDPTGGAGAEFVVARSDELWFTRDIVGDDISGWVVPDGEIETADDEDIRLKLAGGILGRDTNGNGSDNDLQPLLENVDALSFVYLDHDGDVLAAPVTGNDLGRIRSVEVAVVARSWQSDRGLLRKYTDSTSYENLQGDVIFGPANDTSRRLSLNASITCRNM